MGNEYSYQFGCNDGVCPGSNCKQLFLTNNSAGETMTIISTTGAYPIPELVTFFQGCDSGGISGSQSLPCPTANREDAQSCVNPCPSGESFLYDCRNIADGKVCREQGGSGVIGNSSIWHWTSDSLALAIVLSYEACLGRIADLVGGDINLAKEMWPQFYHFYNNSYGKADVDAYVKSKQDAGKPLPQAAIDALHNNFTEDSQRLYGILNEYDFSQQVGNPMRPPQEGQYNSTNMGSPNPNDTVLSYQNGWFNEGDDAGLTLPQLFKKYYFRKTVSESNYGHDLSEYGNPFWTDAERQDAYRLALGSIYPKGATISNGKDWVDIWGQAYANAGLIQGGRSADSYEDPADVPGMPNPYSDPDYSGNLPYKPDEMFAADKIVRETVDTTLHGYQNECDSKSLVEEILPIGCALVVGGVSSMIVPGQLSKAFAFGIGSVSAYEVVSSVYGQQALMWWGTTQRNSGEILAARLITFGFPASFSMGLVELGYIPSAIDTFPKKGAFIVVSGALGYALLGKLMQDSLVTGGDAAEILLSPLSWVDGFLHSIFDGCNKHTGNSTLQCYCENANSKVLLSEALVEDFYGATDTQARLRLECMHAATTSGDWGSDPVHMGVCDPDNGWMDTPTACISAGEFAYQQWDQSMNPKAQNMWDQVSHCVNANNPSFLPPTLQDSECVKKFGKYARAGGITLPGGTSDRWPGSVAGQCYDFRAPKGMQQLGQPTSYDWSQIQQPKSDECTIL